MTSYIFQCLLILVALLKAPSEDTHLRCCTSILENMTVSLLAQLLSPDICLVLLHSIKSFSSPVPAAHLRQVTCSLLGLLSVSVSSLSLEWNLHQNLNLNQNHSNGGVAVIPVPIPLPMHLHIPLPFHLPFPMVATGVQVGSMQSITLFFTFSYRSLTVVAAIL